MRMSGNSHHFFSCRMNRRNSLKVCHITQSSIGAGVFSCLDHEAAQTPRSWPTPRLPLIALAHCLFNHDFSGFSFFGSLSFARFKFLRGHMVWQDQMVLRAGPFLWNSHPVK